MDSRFLLHYLQSLFELGEVDAGEEAGDERDS
jgi:hypothetical protein